LAQLKPPGSNSEALSDVLLLWLGSDLLCLGSDRLWLGSDLLWLGSDRLCLGSDLLWLGSDRLWLGSDLLLLVFLISHYLLL
jgi:hypothetical protein